MPKDPRKRQQKLLKKRRKEKAKNKEYHRASAGGGGVLSAIRNAHKSPITECLINGAWRETGLANILLARKQPNELYTIGVFLVDTGCLGVKNAFCNANLTQSRFDDFRDDFEERNEAISCEVSLAHQIIYGGLDYAAQIGFKPHRDFALAKHVLEPRENFTFDGQVEFGKDGKPNYTSGPHDNVNRIMNHLEKTVGMDNFRFLIRVPDDSGFDDDDDIDDELGETG